MTAEDRPLRTVTGHEVRAGRGGLLGGDTNRRVRWWHLTLDCGHGVERLIKYQPLRPDQQPIRGGQRNRPMAHALPPPKRARCDRCASDA